MFKTNLFSTKYLVPTLLCSALLPAANAASLPQCDNSRHQALADAAAGMSGADIYKKYSGCLKNVPGLAAVPPSLDDIIWQGKSKIIITDTGSTAFEAIKSCGYHPQRKELTCPIEIRQTTGYSGTPALQPGGSYEFVQFCVNYGNGFVPVNVNGVHVHDEAFGAQPNWYMTAVVAADDELFQQPLNGQTLRARAILSWNTSPAGDCNFQPIWGNQADFRIRLDP